MSHHLVLLGEWHVRRVLTDYVTFYNSRRPHQGLDQQCPIPLTVVEVFECNAGMFWVESSMIMSVLQPDSSRA